MHEMLVRLLRSKFDANRKNPRNSRLKSRSTIAKSVVGVFVYENISYVGAVV